MDIGNQIRVITVEPAEVPKGSDVPAPAVAVVEDREEVAAAKESSG